MSKYVWNTGTILKELGSVRLKKKDSKAKEKAMYSLILMAAVVAVVARSILRKCGVNPIIDLILSLTKCYRYKKKLKKKLELTNELSQGKADKQ